MKKQGSSLRWISVGLAELLRDRRTRWYTVFLLLILAVAVAITIAAWIKVLQILLGG